MRANRTIVLLLAVAAAALTGYWYFNPQARPPWLSDRLPVAGSAEVTLYRWRTPEGQWQVSDTPPPEGTRYETVSLRHDTNVLPAPKDD